MPVSASNQPAQGAHRPILRHAISQVLTRAILFAGLWLVIAGSDPASWIIGLPTVLLAILGSPRLSSGRSRPLGLRLTALLRFLPFFAFESVRGGIDVASRVLRPQVKINPGFQRYRPDLEHPAARVLFLDSISLLPGTLSADLRDGIIEVHALDVTSDLTPELRRLERMIGRLFGEKLEEARA